MIGYIGFSDGWGDQVLAATKQSAAADNIGILADEPSTLRTDTSAEGAGTETSMSVHPEAIMMGTSATPPPPWPVVALRHRGFKGGLFGNHGIVWGPAFIKVGGAAAEGVIAVTSLLGRRL